MTKLDMDGIELFIEDADGYLQINDVGGDDLSRIWARLKTGYSGYDKWFCYHNTEVPYNALGGIGASLKDDCIEMRLSADGFQATDMVDVIQITEDNYDEFAAYHDQRHPDMYWTSERIRRDLSRWGIFVLREDDQIVGCLLLAMGDPICAEVFCADAADGGQCERLLRYAAGFAFRGGKKETLYMADANTIGRQGALAAGFAVTGFYKGYQIERAR